MAPEHIEDWRARAESFGWSASDLDGLASLLAMSPSRIVEVRLLRILLERDVRYELIAGFVTHVVQPWVWHRSSEVATVVAASSPEDPGERVQLWLELCDCPARPPSMIVVQTRYGARRLPNILGTSVNVAHVPGCVLHDASRPMAESEPEEHASVAATPSPATRRPGAPLPGQLPLF